MRLPRLLRRMWPRRLALEPPGAIAGTPPEAQYAEAFGQLLLCGLPAAEAIAGAAEVVPGRRFREALGRAGRFYRSGYSLEISLRKAEYRVDPGLLAAAATGEEMGPLADEMLAYARSAVAGDARVLHRALGRTAAAAGFAAALARLLAERPLGGDVIVAAGRIAVGRFPEFTPDVLRQLHDDVVNGSPFADALGRHPHLFDALFVRCVAACQTRPSLRAVLDRLGHLPV